MGEDAERRYKEEMADWDDGRLIAKAAKEPGFAEGIAASQILSERRRQSETARHAELLQELRKPQWKTGSVSV